MSVSTNYNLSSNGYYSLNQSNNTTSPTSLANLLNNDPSSSQSPSADNLSAYMLDLSPAAQSYLNGTTASSSTSAASSFSLSTDQQQKLDGILQKYKGAPYTQDTFDQIQRELQLAGLSPDQLAQEQQIKDFNPTQILVEALNGVNSGSASQFLPQQQDNSGQYDSQKQNFIQNLIQKFQQVAAAGAAG